MEFEGIVIRTSKFREADLMVTVLADDKIHSFLARGVLKLNSKNRYSVLDYARSRFRLIHGKEGLLLREGTILFSPETGENLDALAALGLIGEATNRLIGSDDAPKIYPYLKKTLDMFKGEYEPYSLALCYFAKALLAGGYGIDVDECVLCGAKSGINGVSWADGGFVCSKCFSPLEHKACSGRDLKILRFIFKAGLDRFQSVSFKPGEARRLIADLAAFLDEVGGIGLTSVSLIDKIS